MQWVSSFEGNTAVVLDSPHSGVVYPTDFSYVCDLAVLRKAEDTHVEKLYAFAPELGCSWIEAHFPRSYLDANRNITEIDPSMLADNWPSAIDTSDPAVLSKRRLGKGLIWRFTDNGLPIYNKPLTVAEVERRIEYCWRPYHVTVARAIDLAHARHGYSVHINCHSMPAIATSHATDFPGLAHADFVIGNRDHSTASEALVLLIRDCLKNFGYTVELNHPYKGVELVRRYGDPSEHRHSVQIEINRKLYMNEDSLELHDGFNSLQRHLQMLVRTLIETDPRTI
jgi:N-formylglutamate deformylase